MFKTNKSQQKDTLPEPMGILILKGEKEWREFYAVHTGKIITKVSDNEYQYVDGAYYQITKDKYVPSTVCSQVMYHASSYIPK